MRSRRPTSGPSRSVDVEGQTDILAGTALHLPLQRELHHEPHPGGLPPGSATSSSMYRARPLGQRGRRRDHEAPDPARVPPRPPPELHRLLRAGADPRPSIPVQIHKEFEESFQATDPGMCTSTGPGTPTTACTPSTCGTGAPTPWRTSGGSSSSGATPRPCGGSASRRPAPSTTRSRSPPTSSALSPPLTHMHNPPIFMSDVH